jgi:hypothetical protein
MRNSRRSRENKAECEFFDLQLEGDIYGHISIVAEV